ncbi:MAG: LysR family transcriptional regulator, partial [Ectothiorhodospiraceae bacterium]
MKNMERMLVFAAVVDAGSFTAAAQQLACSKAHVSQQISRLEEELGAQLLFRTTRRLELTEAGQTYLRYCRQLRDTANAAHQAVEALRGEMTGEIRMTVPVSFGDMVLRELVAPFLARYPGIDFQLDLENEVTDLRADRYDMALRTPAPADEDLVAVRLTDYTELLCASPGYLTGAAPIRRPADLAGHRFLVNRYNSGRPWRLRDEQGDSTEVAISRRLVMNNYSIIRRAALGGLGIAKLPDYLI